jgi:hypothetical protein
MAVFEKFPFESPAEIYATGGTTARKRPMSYRRFSTSAEAIRFVIEGLPQIVQRGTVMEVDDERYELADIRNLYDSAAYPLTREIIEAEFGDAPSPGKGK